MGQEEIFFPDGMDGNRNRKSLKNHVEGRRMHFPSQTRSVDI